LINFGLSSPQYFIERQAHEFLITFYESIQKFKEKLYHLVGFFYNVALPAFVDSRTIAFVHQCQVNIKVELKPFQPGGSVWHEALPSSRNR
jgi:hypothetical protein